MTTFRRLTLVVLALVVALGAGLARPDAAYAGDNAAIAINTKDGSSLFKFAFSIKKVAGDVVDQTNAAVAYASCEDCKTTAIAIQIVLVTGNPSVVTPTNLAVAINEGCTLCETFAGAYQIVLGTGGPVVFTPEGRHRIAEIRREIKRLRGEDLSPAELKVRLDDLVDQLKEVLRTQLRPVAEGEEESDVDEQVTEEDRVDHPPQTTASTTTDETTTTSTTTSSTTTSTTTSAPTTTGTTTEPPATTTTTAPSTTAP